MSRIHAPERRGVVARLTGWYARRQYGADLAPAADAWSHTPGLLAGYGAMELALDRSRGLDARLKLLAELKASTVTGCEWCVDFGLMLSRAQGISDQQLRDLPLASTTRWESSPELLRGIVLRDPRKGPGRYVASGGRVAMRPCDATRRSARAPRAAKARSRPGTCDRRGAGELPPARPSRPSPDPAPPRSPASGLPGRGTERRTRFPPDPGIRAEQWRPRRTDV
jgi:AhpD family alkylhydroperoxidase